MSPKGACEKILLALQLLSCSHIGGRIWGVFQLRAVRKHGFRADLLFAIHVESYQNDEISLGIWIPRTLRSHLTSAMLPYPPDSEAAIAIDHSDSTSPVLVANAAIDWGPIAKGGVDLSPHVFHD